MDALISDKESRYYLKLFALTLGIGMEVLHQYFEQKILNTMDFYLFLEQHKHCLFHECYPAVQCCKCCQMSLDAHPKRGCLSEIQFNILFDIAPPTNQDHYKIGRNNTVIIDCLCRIDAKRSNEVDCMDITLMCAIIKSCFLNKKISIHGNPQALETIKKTRNFLAHSCLRISKSEFDSRLAETEIAIVEMASTVGKYLKKLQQRRIEELKNNEELTMETLKRIIESNADEIKKNLQTFIDEQRKTIMLNKDEIIEHLIKYKGKLEELSINIGELRFEVKQYAVSLPDSSTSEEISNTGEVLKMEATSCSSEAYAMEKDELNTQSSVPDIKTTACSTKAHTTEKDMHIKKCRVEWRLETPNTWNLAQIKESLEKFSDLLRQWFEIEFVYVGSLVIKTLVSANVLNDRDKMRNSVQSFLEKVVEVCNINTDVSSVIRVALMVSADDIEAGIQCDNCKKKDNIISGLKEKIYEMSKTVSTVSLDLDLSKKETENITSKLDIKKKDKTTCIYCNLSCECQKCQQKDEIIERLTEEISDIRKEYAELDLEMGVPVAEQIIDDSVNKAQVATGNVISQKTYFARLGHATFHLIPNMIREVLAYFIQPNTLYENVFKNSVLLRRLTPADLQKINKIRETGYRTLDYQVMYTIIRHCLPAIRPSRGWDHPMNPQAHEISLGDDIERCRRYRNSIIHRGNTTVSYQELNEFFSVFKEVARRLEFFLGKEPNEFVSQFDVLKTCSMDEDI